MAQTAPPLPAWHWRPLAPAEVDHELVWLAATAGAALLGLVWLRADLPLPACAFKLATGCPCMTCGATRCVLSLLHGRPATALAWNPLVFLGTISALAFDLYAAAVLLFRLPRLRLRALSPGTHRCCHGAALLALAANWTWVIRHGN